MRPYSSTADGFPGVSDLNIAIFAVMCPFEQMLVEQGTKNFRAGRKHRLLMSRSVEKLQSQATSNRT